MRTVRLTKESTKDILENLLKRSPNNYGKFEAAVADILANVKEKGDEALFSYTKEFDKVEVTPETIRVTEEEIEEAYKAVDASLLEVIRKALVNIRSYHEKQRQNSWFTSTENGTMLGQKVTALNRVGVYVPGGKAVYPSSVLMNIVPAKVAGVDRIVMTTPPGKDGKVCASTLVAAKEAGADEIYKVGGAQAIGALAFGTESIPKVDKIVGPGNIFVALAKKAVYGYVSIDSIAGPSEILVLADETANPHFVAADLLSQAEHDELACAILITTSEEFAAKVDEEVKGFVEVLSRKEIIQKSLDNFGYILIAEDMDEAIEASAKAQKEYMNHSMADRQRYVEGIREVVCTKENLEYMSKLAVEESGMGAYEYKVIKNRLAAVKSPGVEDLTTEALSGDDGLTLVEYCPFGVIGAIAPTTNPTETVICNSIAMLAGGNTVVFSPHPRSKGVSIWLIKKLNAKLEELGAPRNLIVTVKEPSIENTNIMMNHPKVRMLVATGGPGIVKAVMSTGKKAIGAGAGNPPVVVDETADIEKAAKDIVNGCSFDNNLPCIAEKEVIAVDQIADYLIFNMKNNGAYEVKDPEIIEKMVDLVTKDRKKPAVNFVGKSAQYILDKVGIKVGPEVKCIIMEAPKDHPFVQIELMMPILPIVRVPNVDEAIDFAVEVEHGNRHTAMMHSKNVDKLTKMAKEIETTIFVKNGPSYAGIGVGGMGYTTFTIAGPTGEGLTSAKSFCRKRRCVLQDGLHIRMK